jgi:hypothetical protein
MSVLGDTLANVARSYQGRQSRTDRSSRPEAMSPIFQIR